MAVTKLETGSVFAGQISSLQTITVGAVTYVVESAEMSAPSNIAEQRDAAGEPSEFAIVPQTKTVNVTIQLPTATAILPPRGGNFNLDVDVTATEPDMFAGSAGHSAHIVSVSPVFTKGEYAKVTLTCVLQEV